jgi:hypothetical protein
MSRSRRASIHGDPSIQLVQEKIARESERLFEDMHDDTANAPPSAPSEKKPAGAEGSASAEGLGFRLHLLAEGSKGASMAGKMMDANSAKSDAATTNSDGAETKPKKPNKVR